VTPAAHVGGIEFRELTTADELAVLPEFERRIWGGEFEMVSVNVLVATISEGGMAIGAFDGDRLVGAVYGFATREPDVLHSHYMAVDPSHRGRGLAVELKQRQRSWCLQHGITAMRWTYDPLQLGNAHLNIRVLGAIGVAYHANHYGTLGGINGHLPSDRVTVRWDLDTATVRPVAELVVDVRPCTADDIAGSTDAAMAARLALRDALEPRLAEGWRIVDVVRDERRYLLARP
jgi:predicted GNAT superfamily acetyltransferase